MKMLSDKKLLAIIGLVVGLIITIVIIVMPKEETALVEDFSRQTNSLEEDDSGKSQSNELETKVMKVDIKGAVKRPGVYIAHTEDRILDVIEKAGGLSDGADKNKVNLAQRVEDQMLIYVPLIGEVLDHVSVPQVSSAGEGGKAPSFCCGDCKSRGGKQRGSGWKAGDRPGAQGGDHL